MKKIFLYVFYTSLFCILLLTIGHVVLNVTKNELKGAICHQLDADECEKRYEAYRTCITAMQEMNQIEEDIAKEFCFKTSFFGVLPREDKK